VSEDRQLSLEAFDQEPSSNSDRGSGLGVNIPEWPSEETGYDIPYKLLEDLRDSQEPGRQADLCSPITRYLASNRYSKHAQDAAEALELTLENTSPPVDCPELLLLVHHPHVDLGILLEHLLEIYPVDAPELPDGVTIEVKDEMGIVNRFRVYQLMSFLPPDKDIYSQLSKANWELGDDVPYPGWDEEADGSPREWVSRYARRIVELYFEYPSHVPDDLASKAVKDHWTVTVPVVIRNSGDAVGTSLFEQVLDKVKQKPGIRKLRNQTLVDYIIGAYFLTDSTGRSELAELAKAAIDSDYGISDGDSLRKQLATDLLEDGSRPRDTGDLLSRLATGNPDACRIGDQLEWLTSILSVFKHEERSLDSDLRHRAIPHVEVIETVADSSPETVIREGDIDEVVQLARHSNGKFQDSFFHILSAIGRSEPSCLMSHMELLISDLSGIRSATQLERYGELFQALDVYPPPVPLVALRSSTDTNIRSEAASICSKLRQDFRSRDPSIAPEEFSGTLSDLAGQCSIKYQTGPGFWEELDLSEVDRHLLSIVSQAYQEDESTRFVLPYHDPEAVRLALIAISTLLLSDEDPPTAAVYSPGTSGRWGTKKDLRSAYGKFAIDDGSDPSVSVTPFSKLVPTAHVTDSGDIEPDNVSISDGDDPLSLVLARSVEDILMVDPDIVLYNFIPSIDAVEGEAIKGSRSGDSPVLQSDRVVDLMMDPDEDVPELPDHASIEMYGLFTQHEFEDKHLDTGPPLADKGTVVPSIGKRSDETIPRESGDRERMAKRATSSPPAIRVHNVETGNDAISGLRTLYEQTSSLDPSRRDEREVYYKLTRLKRDLERLPVPAGVHDEWVQVQRTEGVFGVPARLVERQGAIEDLSEDYPLLEEAIYRAQKAVETIRESLREDNPLFRALLKVLDDAATQEDQVAVLCPKKTYKDMIDQYLREETETAAVDYTDFVQLGDHDSVRDLDDEVNRIIRFGVAEPQTAIYYAHPSVDQVDVLAYSGTNPELRIKRLLESRRPFFPETVDAGIPDQDIEEASIEVDDAGSGGPPFVDPDESFADALFDAYLRDTDSRSGGSSGHSLKSYRITYENGRTRRVTNGHRLIAKNSQQLVSTGEYVLQRVGNTTAGDTIVHIPVDVRNNLWEEYLRSRYEDNDEVDAILEAVKLWYEAIENALESVEVGDDERITKYRVAYESIAGRVSADRSSGIEWFRSVEEAEDPRDLLFRRELTLGPDARDGVEAVAEEFGSERFQSQWKKVYEFMDSARTTHAKFGSAFWESSVDRARRDELFNYPGVEERTVESVVKI